MNDDSNRSTQTNPVTIFIGHKLDCDRSNKAALAIKRNFSSFSEHLNFLLLTDKPIPMDWRQWIQQCIDRAHIMFLLCTEPSKTDETWTWCMLEVGWFEGWCEGVKHKSNKPLFVFHSPVVQLPSALDPYEKKTFIVRFPAIKGFLRRFFGTTEWFKEFGYDKPLNPGFVENETWLNSVAELICKNFLQPEDVEDIQFGPHTSYDEFLLIRIKDLESLNRGAIPDDALVEDAGDNSLKLFGLSKTPPTAQKWTWRDLKNRLPETDSQRWIADIEQEMQSAGKGHVVKRNETVFQSPYTSESYIPVLQSRRISANEPKIIEFRISFFRQPTKGTLTPASDTRHSVLLSCLILSYRLHWEVCKRYLRELEDFTPSEDGDQQDKLNQIQDAIAAIERESEYRSHFETANLEPLYDRLMYAFDQTSEEYDQVRSNLEQQKRYKQELSAEIAQADTHGIIKQLRQLQQLNNHLSLMIVNQYADVLQELGNSISN